MSKQPCIFCGGEGCSRCGQKGYVKVDVMRVKDNDLPDVWSPVKNIYESR